MSFGVQRKFADLKEGEVIETASITVTEAHVVTFAGLTGDFHPLHTDETFASQTQFRGRIAHGPLIFGLCTGLFVRADPLDTIAFLGMNWELLKAVKLGDTIHVRSKLSDVRITSAKNRAILTHTREVINQDGDVVQQGTTTMMMIIDP